MSKFCGHCGSTLADNATFCPNCGAAITDQGMPQQQFNQPAFQQAMPNAMGAPKAGMSKNAKLAIIIAAAAVAIGLIVWLIIVLLGGGYEKPLKNYVKALEKQDVDLFVESVTPSGSLGALETLSESSAKSQYSSRVKNIINKYGEDYKISYEILEKTEMSSTQTLGLFEGYTLKVKFTVSGSKKEGSVTRTVRVIKTGGKWCLGSAPSLV
ncbi:MAG: zinc ribbon domain-containing protein [Ruminococcus sp.]|nr:zinc ribbon domain-containing protein [Ruminococcus sp.]